MPVSLRRRPGDKMADTMIELHAPAIEGQHVVFSWTEAPPTGIYDSTSFRLTFPTSIDPGALPERLWWTVFLLCVHSHWAVMRPCSVRIPVTLPSEEIEVWSRLIETHVATAEAQRDSHDYGGLEISCHGPVLDPLPQLDERGIVAASFSGGKDSMVQAAMLFELGRSPLLVATTSPMPGLIDHGTSHRRRAFDEVVSRRGARLVEVESDLRSAWDNAGASRRGFPFGVNEISDTFLYTAALLAVGYAFGATHLFLASENEVSQNHVENGRFLQHPHFMYSATTQAAIRALLAPAGIYYGSLISALHSSQVQQLLTTRYTDLRDLQFSCWRTTEERRACSKCSECKRLGWLALSLGEAPSELGIDLLYMLLNYDDPEVASRVHTYPPSAETSARMKAQTADAVSKVPMRRVVAQLVRERPSALVGPAGWRALARFRRLRREVLSGDHVGPSGYRAGYLETVDPELRDGVAGIFDAHFPREAGETYMAQLERQREAIRYITEPLRVHW